ncbi:MAG: HindIII family type II restriction endonuclease [Marinirhabdus sp.]
MFKILSAQAIARRKKWVEKICQIDGGFAESAVVLQKELEKEVKKEGVGALHDHLRLCGHIPKSYGRYSS